MTKKQRSSPEELMKAALALPAQPSRIKAADYRDVILLLLQKHISHERIAGFLREQGVSIHQSAISRYLRKHPPTPAEQIRIKAMVARGSTAVVAEQQSPSEHQGSSGSQSEGGTSRKRRRPIDEDDGIDYSFLNMEGRPFTIREEGK